jgi:hypothetical protein
MDEYEYKKLDTAKVWLEAGWYTPEIWLQEGWYAPEVLEKVNKFNAAQDKQLRDSMELLPKKKK